MSHFKPKDVTPKSKDLDLLLSALNSDNLELMKSVVRGCLDTVSNYVNGKGETVLHTVIKTINPVNLQSFLELVIGEIDINAINNTSDTALHKAAYDAPYDNIEILLKYGADPNKANKNGRTPAHNAAYKSRADVLNLMLDAEMDISMVTNKKHDVIKEASAHGVSFKDGKFESARGSSSQAASSDVLQPILEELRRITEEQTRLAQAQQEIIEMIRSMNMN